MDAKTLSNRKTRRTTLTLEADVADYVQRRLASDRSLKEKTVINDLLRKGIRAAETDRPKPVKIKPFKTQLAEGMTIQRLEELMREI